jgi:transposase-like protein
MAKKIKRRGNSELMFQLLEQYKPQNAQDLQEAFKDLMGDALEMMLEAELDGELGYEKHAEASGISDNRRNGTTPKKVKSSFGELDISVPRDREGVFEPQVVKKREKDISEIESKVIAMYSRGMSQRDIGETINEIYGFTMIKDMISKITDKILPDVLA